MAGLRYWNVKRPKDNSFRSGRPISEKVDEFIE